MDPATWVSLPGCNVRVPAGDNPLAALRCGLGLVSGNRRTLSADSLRRCGRSDRRCWSVRVSGISH